MHAFRSQDLQHYSVPKIVNIGSSFFKLYPCLKKVGHFYLHDNFGKKWTIFRKFYTVAFRKDPWR